MLTDHVRHMISFYVHIPFTDLLYFCVETVMMMTILMMTVKTVPVVDDFSVLL